MNHFVEIRSYNLKPNTRGQFHRLFIDRALPMLQCWDEDSYYLIRRYNSLAHREQSQGAFYGSEEWKQGPRESILGLIENYTSIVLELNEAALRRLRR